MALGNICNHAYTITSLELPDGTKREMCTRCQRQWGPGLEAPKVILKASGNKTSLLKTYITNRGDGNVILHEVLSPSNIENSYALRCKVCSTQLCWKWDFKYELGIEINELDSFCYNHSTCQLMSVPKQESSVIEFKKKQELPPEPKGRKFRE